jgi:hypothetical protein
MKPSKRAHQAFGCTLPKVKQACRALAVEIA